MATRQIPGQHKVEEADSLPHLLPNCPTRKVIEVILTQHYLACLSHASYLVGDESTGRAVVVDPRRDVGVYLQEAALRDLRIERVIETHVHADFLSGHLELANRADAIISYGPRGGGLPYRALARRATAVAGGGGPGDLGYAGPHSRVDLRSGLGAPG